MQLLVAITVLYSLIPPLVYWFIKNKLNSEIKPVFPFIVLCFLAGLYEFIFTILLRVNTLPWFYTYDVLYFFTIQYFFYYILEKKIKNIVWISSSSYIILFVYFVVNNSIKNYLTHLSYLSSITTFLIIIFSIMWFKKTFKETNLESLAKSSSFYFVSGFLIYNSGVIVLFLLSNSMYANDSISFHYFWIINLFFNMIHKTILIVGIWKARIN